MLSSEQIANIRADFPILERIGRGGNPIAYLDSAATAQKPSPVLEAMGQFYLRSNGAVSRGTHLLADESTSAFENARETIAGFFGISDASELVFTKNATEAVNVLAGGLLLANLGENGHEVAAGGYPLRLQPVETMPRAFRLTPQDRIIVTKAEHHANLLPWQRLAEVTGAQLSWIEVNSEGRITPEALEVIDEHTAVVAVTHISNVTGAITPVVEVVRRARAAGALVALDTCQSAMHLPLNLIDLGVDAACFSSHKMMGPTGVGALWARKEILDYLPPLLLGGSMVASSTTESADFQSAPMKFEAGSQPVAQVVGWAAAIDYIQGIGLSEIAEYERQLTRQMLSGLELYPQLKVLGPASPDAPDRIGAVSFLVDGIHPHDIGQVLDSFDIAVRTGHHCVIPLHKFFGTFASTRASLAVFNTPEEIDRLIAGIGEVLDFFGRK